MVKELPLPFVVKAQLLRKETPGIPSQMFAKTAPAPDSVFNEVVGLQLAPLLQKRLHRRCFPMNSMEYLRTPFL